MLRQPALAATLAALAHDRLAVFYTGDLARSIAADLAAFGTLYNRAPPTQGLAALLILVLLERLAAAPESFAHIHGLVEATKQAFLIRDVHVGDRRS